MRLSDQSIGEPALADDVLARELDREVRAELRSLGKSAAESVARRLVATGELLDVDPREALAHALVARRQASRIAAVREAVGIAAYHAGEWQMAIAELRAYHRMAGRQTHIALLADCERALGRPERAVDMFRHADRKTLGVEEWIELLIVASGARRDLGQIDASVTVLQVPELESTRREPGQLRLTYAYAEALLAAGREDEAATWFERTLALDPDGETGAADRLLELQGIEIEGDLTDEDDQPDTDPVNETEDDQGEVDQADGDLPGDDLDEDDEDLVEDDSAELDTAIDDTAVDDTAVDDVADEGEAGTGEDEDGEVRVAGASEPAGASDGAESAGRSDSSGAAGVDGGAR